jgi:hypothetical protein
MFCLSCGSGGLIRFSFATSAQVEVNAEEKRGSDEHHGNHHHEKVFFNRQRSDPNAQQGCSTPEPRVEVAG